MGVRIASRRRSLSRSSRLSLRKEKKKKKGSQAAAASLFFSSHLASSQLDSTQLNEYNNNNSLFSSLCWDFILFRILRTYTVRRDVGTHSVGYPGHGRLIAQLLVCTVHDLNFSFFSTPSSLARLRLLSYLIRHRLVSSLFFLFPYFLFIFWKSSKLSMPDSIPFNCKSLQQLSIVFSVQICWWVFNLACHHINMEPY